MKRGTAFFLLFIFLFQFFFSEYVCSKDLSSDTWSKVIGYEKPEIATSVVINSRNEIIVKGVSETYVNEKEYPQVSEGLYSIQIVNMSQEGVINWVKRYGGPENNFPVTYLMGHYLTQLHWKDYATRSEVSNTAEGGLLVPHGNYLMKLDANGGVQWTKKLVSGINHKDRINLLKAVELNNGIIVVFGTVQIMNSLNQSRIFLAKLDSNGNILWQGSYIIGGSTIFSDLEVTAEDEFVIGCFNMLNNKPRTQIYYIDENGNIKWSKLLIFNENNPPDYRECMLSIKVDSSGNIYGSSYYGLYGRQSVIFKFSKSGSLLWTNRISVPGDVGGETFFHDIDINSDGNVIFAGRTTIFLPTESKALDHYDFDTVFLCVSPAGEPIWLKSFGRDRVNENVLSIKCINNYIYSVGSSYSSKVAEMQFSCHRLPLLDFLIVKMDSQGDISSAGELLFPYNLEDRKNSFKTEAVETKIENGPKDVTDLGLQVEPVNFDSIDVTLGEETVEGLAKGTLSFEPLYPSSQSEVSEVMQGGIAYRYFTLKNEIGVKIPNALIKYHTKFVSSVKQIKVDENGELAFAVYIPKDQEISQVENPVHIDGIFVNGIRYSKYQPPAFSLSIVPLSYSSNWTAGMGSSAKAGIGLGAASIFGQMEETGGMLLIRTKNDSLNSNNDSLGVNENTETATTIGLEAGVEFGGKAGPVEAKALNATASITQSIFGEFTTLFNAPSNSSTSEKLLEGFSILTGVANCLSAGTTETLNMVINAIVAAISEKVMVREILQGFGIKITEQLTGIKLGLSKKKDENNSYSMDGLGIGNFEENLGVKMTFTQYVSQSETSGKITLRFDIGISAVKAFGFSLGSIGEVQELSLEVFFNTSNLDFKRVIISYATPPDSHGEVQVINFYITREMLGNAINEIEQLTGLIASGVSVQDNNLLIDENMLAALINTIITKVPKIRIPYDRVVIMDKTPTSIEIGLGIKIAGFQVDLGAKPKFGYFKSYPYETGVLVPIDVHSKLMKLVKYTDYSTDLFSKDVDKLPDMIVDILSAVGDIIGKAWNAASGLLSNLTDTVIDVGSGLGGTLYGAGEAIFDAGTNFLSASNEPDLLSISSVSASKSKEITLLCYTPQGNDFIVGNFYAFKPDKSVSRPATFTISYEDIAIQRRDESKFYMYAYDPLSSAWMRVENQERFPQENKIIAKITKLGEYCIGYDEAPPSFELISVNANEILAFDRPSLKIRISEGGSGVSTQSISVKINNKDYSFEYDKKLQVVEVKFGAPLSKGQNVLEISASDTAGNQGNKSFNLTYYLIPSRPEIEVASITEEYIDLRISGVKKGEAEVKKLIIEKAEPYNGKMFHQIASLEQNFDSFKDSSLASKRIYAYRAYVVDEKGYKSQYSNVVYATSKLIPVNPPSNLKGTQKENSVNLTWTSPKIIGSSVSIVIYRGASEADVTEKIAELKNGEENFEDKSVKVGEIYYYKLSAYDVNDPQNVSQFSNVVKVELKESKGHSASLLLGLIVALLLVISAVIAFFILRKKK